MAAISGLVATWARRLTATAGVVGVTVAAACTTTPSSPTFDGQPATVATASFALFGHDDQLLVVTGEQDMPVHDPHPTGTVQDFESTAAAPIDANTLAVVSPDRLSVVRRDGTASSATCRGCQSVIWTGQDLAVLRPADGQGQTFEILRYSRDLEPAGQVTGRQLTERTDPEAERTVGSGVQLLAASPTTVWVGYEDRFGFSRGGSRTIAAYARDGTLLRINRVPGSIYASAVSDDGRYLAVTDGGSSGACITAAELDVMDLTTMKSLDTSQRIPTSALLAADPDDLPDLNFAAFRLVWHGGIATALGETSRGNAEGANASGCDPEAKQWARHYDTRTQTFTDVEIAAQPDVFVGPDCADRVRQDARTSSWEVVAGSGARRQLDSAYTLLLYKPRPTNCPESS
jgi:hypothetical protein